MSSTAATLGADIGPRPVVRPIPQEPLSKQVNQGVSPSHKSINKKKSSFLSKVGGKIKETASKAGQTAKQIGKKVKYGAEVGLAAADLAQRVVNPINRVKFAAKALKGEGFVFPGSKYIGPGNRMDLGEPVNEADANAYQHDIDYDNYLKQGHSPFHVYTSWSDADKRLLEKTKANTAEGLAVNLGMLAKKGLFKLGLTKRLRDRDVPRKK